MGRRREKSVFGEEVERKEYYEVVASAGGEAAAYSAGGGGAGTEGSGSEGESEDERKRRVRKKRRVGRKCAGMCYAPPPLPQALVQLEAKERREKKNKRAREKKREKKRQKMEDRSQKVGTEGNGNSNNKGGDGDGGAEEGSRGEGSRGGRSTMSEEDQKAMISYLNLMLSAQQDRLRTKKQEGEEGEGGAAGQEEVKLEPTAVQSSVWPFCLQGYDVRAKAETGTGKTFAYMFPLLHRLGPGELEAQEKEAEGKRPIRALVLVPTRELAKQVLATVTKLRAVTRQRGLCVIGGIAKKDQVEALDTSEPDVVIATPGRLCDLIDNNQVDLSSVRVLVIDEADKMLQMGFDDDLQKIHRQLGGGEGKGEGESGGRDRQTLLFSATFPKALLKRCKTWLDWDRTKMVEIREGQSREGGGLHDADAEGGALYDAAKSSQHVSANVTQIVHVCAEHKKEKKLIKYIEQVRREAKEMPDYRHVPKILVFVNTIKKARTLFAFLHKQSLFNPVSPKHSKRKSGQSGSMKSHAPSSAQVAMIHGKRNQKERNEAIQAFKSGKTNTLIATDIVGRGIHIPGLRHVVLYDFPPSLDQYVHRVGRTGRQQDKGTSYAFFTRNLAPLAPSLVDLLRKHDQKVDPHLVKVAEAASEAMKVLGEKNGSEPASGGKDG
ncbi:DEAD-box ATP-dependent RNA helicase [Chloropicon primus]|uniref:DEAD-box ATP-dependent RNA helicase n=2 Tax=Chloropicon primus TaxID=1764295 RepID=A0A5B8N2P4_9CHLO|nr:DEAD-box ATP-dependent RNA helicase [Chloropicon primus]UPR05145.1 DEAD-box ATP-dependent RNA helicase [Chloropicon primus]|eukprot:QDZ25944.1 DEAD-box ATP-dependent RNA helicase [Chloropicon primus]